MKYETAGDPIGELKWTRRTTRKIAKALDKIGIHVSKNTVGRLLKSIDFRLRVNHKKRSTTSPPERDAQFRYIKKMREAFVKRGDPVISIDCKKKELVGALRFMTNNYLIMINRKVSLPSISVNKLDEFQTLINRVECEKK